MRKVYRYQFPDDEYFEIEMPKGAKILTFQVQMKDLCIWALVDPAQPFESRKFRFAGTGNKIEEAEENLIYIGTSQEGDGGLVWHLFEIK